MYEVFGHVCLMYCMPKKTEKSAIIHQKHRVGDSQFIRPFCRIRILPNTDQTVSWSKEKATLLYMIIHPCFSAARIQMSPALKPLSS